MERRRETTRTRAAERPGSATLVAIGLGLLALLAIVVLIVPR